MGGRGSVTKPKQRVSGEADSAAGKCFDYMVGGCWVKRSRRTEGFGRE